MKRTMSSLRPFGALTLSISVVKPYLYLSTSISWTRLIVSCTGVAMFTPRLVTASAVASQMLHSLPGYPVAAITVPSAPAAANLRKNGQKPLDIRFCCRPTRRDADCTVQLGAYTHGGEHVRALSPARGARRARAQRNSFQVECYQHQ